jgi:hypothetical protein
MQSGDTTKASRVKEVTELIHSQHWSFNDFLLTFYSSSDPSIVTQRGRCLTKSDGARFAPEELIDLWLDHCPANSRCFLEHVIVNRASHIITKEADKACTTKSLCVPATSITDDDLDEGFLLSKLETEYTTTLPLLWLFLYAIVTSANRSEQQKQQAAASKEMRAKFVSSPFVTTCPWTEKFNAGMCRYCEHPALFKKPGHKRIPNHHGHISRDIWGNKTCFECLQSHGNLCQLRVCYQMRMWCHLLTKTSSVESALVQLTKSSKARARNFVKHGKRLWCLVYDNINFTLRKASQRLQNTTEQVNATTSAVVALPACFSTPSFKDACNVPQQSHQSRNRQEMTLDKLIPTPEQQGQLRTAFRHAVHSLLLENLGGLAAGDVRTTNIKKKVLAKKPIIRRLSGAGEKTDFYPLPALDEEEASVKGTIRVVQKLIHSSLKLTAQAASSTLRLFVGDWLTIRNLRLMKYMRITEPDSWSRMNWVQEAAMPFHFQLNAVHMLVRTHLGESSNDPSSLDRHRTRLQRYKLDKKKPEYNRACELIEHSLIARLLDITRFDARCFRL